MALVMLIILLICMACVKLGEEAKGAYYKKQDDRKAEAALAMTKDGNLALPGREIYLKKDIEDDVKQKFFDGKFECLETIQNDLREVFGKNWREMFENYPCYYGWYKFGRERKAKEYDSFLTLDYFRNIWSIAYQIWLSNQGLIPYGKAKYSLWEEEIGGFEERKPTANYTSDTIIQAANNERANRDNHIKALVIRTCKVIERNMRKNHPGEIMCFANYSPQSDIQALRGVAMLDGDNIYSKPCLIWAHIFREHNRIPLSFPW